MPKQDIRWVSNANNLDSNNKQRAHKADNNSREMLPDRRNKDDLRAHMTNVELQIKSALRIIASESKEGQQAHSSLRADLSSALLRLQADLNGSASDSNSEIDRLDAGISFLNRQRRVGRVIFWPSACR